MMTRIVGALVFAVATLTVASAPLEAADAFNDTTCPNVTDAGRHLNEMLAASSLLTDDLVAAAQALVDGYRVCMRGYDSDTYNNPEASGQQHTNATMVGRVYARLGLARSLDRVGTYAVDGKRYADAKSAFDEALKRIDEMKTIPSLDTMGGIGDSPEHRLIQKGDDLRKHIVMEEAALPN